MSSARRVCPIFCVFFTISSLLGCAGQGPRPQVEPSRRIRFELPDLNGHQHPSEAFEGRYVLLHLWASWCLPCTFELSNLQNLWSKAPREKFLIVGVAVQDDWHSVVELVNFRRITFPILLDKNAEISQLLGTRGLPTTILLDPSGHWIPILDPKNMTSSNLIAGPRQWDKPEVVQAFKNWLAMKGSS